MSKAKIEKAAVPTQTLGTSRENMGSDLTGETSVYLSTDTKLGLTGMRRFDVYDRLMKDFSIVAASMRLILNLLSNAQWTVNPPEGLSHNEQAVAQGYADTAYNALFNMTSSWASVVRKTAMFRFMGFSIMEWTAKRNDDGTIGFLDIEHRPQRTITKWNRDKGGTVESVIQQVSGLQPVELPRGKIVYAVDDVMTDQPEGVGLLRHIAAAAERLEEFLELERIGYQTDLRGIPIARAPITELNEAISNAEDGDEKKKKRATKAAALEPMRQFMRNHIRNREQGMLLPSDVYAAVAADNTTTPSSTEKWGMSLLQGDSSAFEPMAKAIERLNHEMARIMGCEHLMLGEGGGGSLALSKSKVGTFYLMVSSTLQELVEVYDRDIIGPMAEMNNWEEALRPEMGVSEISDRDIQDVTLALLQMSQAGAVLTPDDPAIGEVRDMLGLSRPDPVKAELDASLLRNRNAAPEPTDPNAPVQNPEDSAQQVKKVYRPNRANRRRSHK